MKYGLGGIVAKEMAGEKETETGGVKPKGGKPKGTGKPAAGGSGHQVMTQGKKDMTKGGSMITHA